MKVIKQFLIFADGQLQFRSCMSEVLEFLMARQLGVDDVQWIVTGGFVCVNCE